MFKDIKVFPESVIVFNSSPYQTVGQIKIIIPPQKKNWYKFNLKTTNKQSYKVSQANGVISSTPYVISIFLKNLKEVEQRLKDIFKLQITIHQSTSQAQPDHPFVWKYRVSIQQAKNITNSEITNYSQNISRNTSIYTTPSLQTSNSIYPISNNLTSKIIRKKSIRSIDNTKEYEMQKEQQKLKQKTNLSLIELKDNKRKLENIIYEKAKIHATNRFRIYMTFIIFILMFLSGLLIGKIAPKIINHFIRTKEVKPSWKFWQ